MRIPIVNEQDEIIGEEERAVIHRDGLRHREIHVWLVTPQKEFIFQKRGPHQDTWPGYLDVTVGGHVDTKTESYEECAKRELYEETGTKLPITLIIKRYSESYDPNTQTKNHAFRAVFGAIYTGALHDLKVEEGNGQGFIKYSLEELKSLSEEDRKKFIPRYFTEAYFDLFQKIITTLFSHESQN